MTGPLGMLQGFINNRSGNFHVILEMNKFVIFTLLSLAIANSGDMPGGELKGPRPHVNIWRLNTTQRISKLETTIWGIGGVCIMIIVAILTKSLISIAYSRKRTKYHIKTDILKSDENTNLQTETYL